MLTTGQRETLLNCDRPKAEDCSGFSVFLDELPITNLDKPMRDQGKNLKNRGDHTSIPLKSLPKISKKRTRLMNKLQQKKG
ncbi:hypothetical protein ACQ4M4_06650 [Leptolyngbya sp. AN02str]|uniref:hypothetical protein n=1 Tax=Leptolyngbya sp. AN02str TaxID=3423363 RepID=UPI003D3134AA